MYNFLVTGFHHVLSQSCYLFIDYPFLQVRLRPQNWYFLGSESHSLTPLKCQTKLFFHACPIKPFFNNFHSFSFLWIGLFFHSIFFLDAESLTKINKNNVPFFHVLLRHHSGSVTIYKIITHPWMKERLSLFFSDVFQELIVPNKTSSLYSLELWEKATCSFVIADFASNGQTETEKEDMNWMHPSPQ